MNRADHKAGRLDRQSYKADFDGAIFEFLYHLVAEVAIDADLHARKPTVIFGKNVGQHVETRGFVRADGQRAVRRAGLVCHGAQRFVAQRQKLAGVFKKRLARDRQSHGLAYPIKQLLPVFLLELANLGAHGRLRAV